VRAHASPSPSRSGSVRGGGRGGGGSSATGLRGAAGKERVGAGGKRGRVLTRVRAAQTRDGVGMCIVCLHAWLSSFPLLFAFMLVMLRAAQAILLNYTPPNVS
jgi:hypothetical protein